MRSAWALQGTQMQFHGTSRSSGILVWLILAPLFQAPVVPSDASLDPSSLVSLPAVSRTPGPTTWKFMTPQLTRIERAGTRAEGLVNEVLDSQADARSADDEAAPGDATPLDVLAANTRPTPDPPLLATVKELALFDLVNSDRARNGLDVVQFAPDLLPIARERARAQLDQSSLNHYDAFGRLDFVVLLNDSGIAYRRAGENLVRLGGSDATLPMRAETALMESPTHRANILQYDFDYLAVGAVIDARGSTTYAQIFRHP